MYFLRALIGLLNCLSWLAMMITLITISQNPLIMTSYTLKVNWNLGEYSPRKSRIEYSLKFAEPKENFRVFKYNFQRWISRTAKYRTKTMENFEKRLRESARTTAFLFRFFSVGILSNIAFSECIQLFRARLSYIRLKAHGTISKSIYYG